MTAETQAHEAHDERHEHPISIRIDNRLFHVAADDMTGAELKALGSIPTDYQLFREVPGPEPDPGIRDDEVIELRSGEKFYGVPSGTLG